MSKYEVYKKNTDPVEVYEFTGENYQDIIDVLEKNNIHYTYLDTPVPINYKITAYKRSIIIQQDLSVFTLTPGMCLVHDTGKTFMVFTKERLRKLFERSTNYGVY